MINKSSKEHILEPFSDVNSNFFKKNLDSLHARLNSHYKEWSYKKKKHKRIKTHRKSGYKEPTLKKMSVNSRLKGI